MSSDKERDNDEEWVVLIQNELTDSNYALDVIPCPSIFMASSPLRGLRLEAFVPQVVSIGPLHSDLGPHHSAFPDNQETERYKAIAAKEMEKHKIVAARHLSKSFVKGDVNALAQDIRKVVDKVRDQYDTDLTCKVDVKLAYMLALDAAFVVEVLRSSADPSRDSGFNVYFCKRFPRPLRKSVLQDFVLLENQLPLFLLVMVLAMDKDRENEAGEELSFLVTKVAREVLPFSLSDDSILSVKKDIRARAHLLDCLYQVVTYGGSAEEGRNVVENPTHFAPAMYLYSCGVDFKAVVPGNMASTRYDANTATLYVPKITVGDDTERLFRNLIAYESHLVSDITVLSYLRFMNSLVDTAEDVALLVEKDIIVQDIGSNQEVADLFNNLCVNTMRACTQHYEDIAQGLSKHCQSKFNAMKAEFKRIYLSRPWLVVSVVSAVALLLMTVVITYYTVLIFYKPEGTTMSSAISRFLRNMFWGQP